MRISTADLQRLEHLLNEKMGAKYSYNISIDITAGVACLIIDFGELHHMEVIDDSPRALLLPFLIRVAHHATKVFLNKYA